MQLNLWRLRMRQKFSTLLFLPSLTSPPEAGSILPAAVHPQNPLVVRFRGSRAGFRTHDSMSAPQLRKGGTSVMRYEFNQLNRAMIGALQDCLLSALPR
jgi:hypothetical protein